MANQARLAFLAVTHRHKRARCLWLEQFQIPPPSLPSMRCESMMKSATSGVPNVLLRAPFARVSLLEVCFGSGRSGGRVGCPVRVGGLAAGDDGAEVADCRDIGRRIAVDEEQVGVEPGPQPARAVRQAAGASGERGSRCERGRRGTPAAASSMTASGSVPCALSGWMPESTPLTRVTPPRCSSPT